MYEHKCIRICNLNISPFNRLETAFREKMDKLEPEGWEIIGIVPEDPEITYYRVFLKRPKNVSKD